MIIQYQFGTIQNLQRALIPQTSNWSGNIFGRFLQQTGSRSHTNGLCVKNKMFPIQYLGKTFDENQVAFFNRNTIQGVNIGTYMYPMHSMYQVIQSLSLSALYQHDFGYGVSILGIQNFGDFGLKVTRFKESFLYFLKLRNAELTKIGHIFTK